MTAARLNQGGADLSTPRNVDCNARIHFIGLDLAGAGLLMQVRLYPGAAGPALLEFKTGAGAGLPSLIVTSTMAGIVPVSTVAVYAHRNLIQPLPAPPEAGGDTVLHYDLITNGVGFPTIRQLAKGRFIVESSVSIIE